MAKTENKPKAKVKIVPPNADLDVAPSGEWREATAEETAQHHSEVDEITGKKMVSFRFDLELIEKLRILAKKDGLGYQTLVRQVLSRYVEENKSRL